MARHAPIRFRPTLLALAAAAAFTPAFAADEKTEEQKLVEAAVDVGFGYTDGSAQDRAFHSQYDGVPRTRHIGLKLDFEYGLRNPKSNSWVQVEGRDLGGHQRELAGVWKRPGDWKAAASYRELTRQEPHAVVPPAGGEQYLKTRRTDLGLALQKTFMPDLVLDVDLRHEKKEGSRLFGRGFTCPSPSAPGCAGTTGVATGWAVLLMPEPIDASHSEVDARVSYARGPLRASVGYYGSWYRNANSVLATAVPGSLANAVGTFQPLGAGLQAILNQPVALAPDNQAQQVDFTGSYDIAAHTRATMKLAWARATQDDPFTIAGAPAGVTSLGGKVTTTLAKLGITSRPVAKLFLIGDLRYEDRDDDTPVALYNVEGTNTYTNRRLPQRKVRGKGEAQWQFTPEWRASLGADYESIDRGVFTATSAVGGITALRQDTEETGVFAEIRRRMSADVSGALRLSRSDRKGSNWLLDNSGRGVTEVPDADLPLTAILMPTLADRHRDKAKLFVDWQASDELTLQLGLEEGRDSYDQLRGYGLGSTRMGQYSLDGTYAFNEKWNVTGYASYGKQALNQVRPAGYVMALRNESWTLGAGVTGKPMGNLQVGVNLSHTNDRSSYDQALDVLAGADSATLLAATGGLPDIRFQQTALRVFGKYTLDAKSSIRADLLWQRTRWNDWAWNYNGVPFAFSDGTTVAMQPKQDVVFVGVTYRRNF
ncbi:MAG: MtrB/PioB family decaheme-associated outer membrane protein [Burkholderiales bacterium]|nr:MtrB/PioB family decaheme-associated outer membrane protein [Burkholderiales bacterium]